MRHEVVNKVVDRATFGPLPSMLEMSGFSFSEFGGIFVCYLI
jgi:hypothetical protein